MAGDRSGLDVMVMGRICVDLYPMQVGVGLKDVASFTKSIGGSAANVAVAIARYGHAVSFVTRTGDDAFGVFEKEQLARFGVDVAHVRPVAGMQSVLTFCEIFPPDHFPIHLYRNPTAPDMYIAPEEVPVEAVRGAAIYWATATGLSREPSRAAHIAAWEARAGRTGSILDLDHRPAFWESRALAEREVSRALDYVEVAIGNREECEVAVGESDPDRAADALLERGVRLAVVKQGPKGVLAKTRDQTVRVAPIGVDVVNGLGAGDAFGGGLVHGLLEGWPLERTLAFANAAGAYVATQFECSSAMPAAGQVEELLAKAGIS